MIYIYGRLYCKYLWRHGWHWPPYWKVTCTKILRSNSGRCLSLEGAFKKSKIWNKTWFISFSYYLQYHIIYQTLKIILLFGVLRRGCCKYHTNWCILSCYESKTLLAKHEQLLCKYHVRLMCCIGCSVVNYIAQSLKVNRRAKTTTPQFIAGWQ